jgi:hypoxanthine-guanine phosphoribosyltransferase
MSAGRLDHVTPETVAAIEFDEAAIAEAVERLAGRIARDYRGEPFLLLGDNGLTLQYLQRLLAGRNPASLRTCVLLDKPYRRRVDVQVDYIGLTAPDTFIVGYGLDYQEKYRNLPYLARLHDWAFRE